MNSSPRGRPFVAGISGNPKGRPSGGGSIAELRTSIAEHIPEIIAKQVELAKKGDPQAARLLLERVIPPLKAAEVPATLAATTTASLADQGREIVASIASGELSPGQGSQVLSALSTLAALIETDELSKRLVVLEEQQRLKA
jgi:hypothetical protein